MFEVEIASRNSLVSALVLAFNVRARRAFEGAGFAVEGVLKQDRRSGNGWVDAILLARCRPA